MSKYFIWLIISFQIGVQTQSVNIMNYSGNFSVIKNDIHVYIEIIKSLNTLFSSNIFFRILYSHSVRI